MLHLRQVFFRCLYFDTRSSSSCQSPDLSDSLHRLCTENKEPIASLRHVILPSHWPNVPKHLNASSVSRNNKWKRNIPLNPPLTTECHITVRCMNPLTSKMSVTPPKAARTLHFDPVHHDESQRQTAASHAAVRQHVLPSCSPSDMPEGTSRVSNQAVIRPTAGERRHERSSSS